MISKLDPRHPPVFGLFLLPGPSYSGQANFHDKKLGLIHARSIAGNKLLPIDEVYTSERRAESFRIPE